VLRNAGDAGGNYDDRWHFFAERLLGIEHGV
jgi:hypothetical protein